MFVQSSKSSKPSDIWCTLTPKSLHVLATVCVCEILVYPYSAPLCSLSLWQCTLQHHKMEWDECHLWAVSDVRDNAWEKFGVCLPFISTHAGIWLTAPSLQEIWVGFMVDGIENLYLSSSGCWSETWERGSTWKLGTSIGQCTHRHIFSIKLLLNVWDSLKCKLNTVDALQVTGGVLETENDHVKHSHLVRQARVKQTTINPHVPL